MTDKGKTWGDVYNKFKRRGMDQSDAAYRADNWERTGKMTETADKYTPKSERSSVTDPGFNPSGSQQIDHIKRAALEFEDVLRANAPNGRRLSIALTHLETATMYAVKAAAVGDD